MTTEDDDLLARIGKLAGQINQHKNQAAPSQRGAHHSTPHNTHTGHHVGWAPYRGRGRPHRRGSGPHRHRTLVLNNQAGGSDAATATPSTDVSNDETVETRPGQQSGWIAKRDRHMQLINPAIYDQETQARTKAIEESRKLKAQKRAERDQAKVMRHVQVVGRGDIHQGAGHGDGAGPSTSYQIVVHGIPFQVAQGGSKLVRSSGDSSAANVIPKKVGVGGVTFVRSKKGNLHRLGAVVSKKKPRIVKKNELCKRFTAMGSCHKGPNCPYVHDPNKVAICKDFLQTGKCAAGAACDLSHQPSPERSPGCVHFIRGRCTNPSCRYAHIRVTPGAPVCRDFAVLGYCSKGAQCEERHVHECPDYANTGQCNNKRCQLPHIDRAGQIRKLEANKAGKDSAEEDDEDEDISSEEEAYDEIDSDDVDSDELDEPEEFTQGSDRGEVSRQQDFIRF